MDKIALTVLEAYPKFIIDRIKSPTYIKLFTKKVEDVLFVRGKNRVTTTTTSAENGYINNKVSEELELTGSPLKLDLSLHTILDDTMITDEPQLWSKEEASHTPIEIEKAREIANTFNKSLRNLSKDEVLPMWLLCSPSVDGKPLLLSIQSNIEEYNRGIVTYEGAAVLEDLAVDELIDAYVKQENLSESLVDFSIDCTYLVSGISYSSRTSDELLNAPQSGLTELHCEWTTLTLHTPLLSCKVNLQQEVIIGHLASPCNAIWKSVCALYNINQLLVDLTAAGCAPFKLDGATIRPNIPGMKRPNPEKRLKDLLNLTETYSYTAEYPIGGCICVTDDTTSLRQCFADMCSGGSSNDFTYCLWDVLRECETAEELVSLLLQALTFISSGKIRPFIDASNKTYLSKLVLKLSRGHSQAAKVLKNIRNSAPQALSIVAQVGMEKTTWEYTRVMSLIEHGFHIAGIWNSDVRTQESVEQINQTILDMTNSGGDFNFNPFESFTTLDHSIRLDCESFYEEDPNELTVDDFASFKTLGVANEKKDVNEVPLIVDEIDISPWKNLLMKYAQIHVCVEHLYRIETSLRADFEKLKSVTSRLLEHYVSDKSPVKTVGQLMSDPVQRISMLISNNIVQDQLKKPAFWYRMEIARKSEASETGVKRDSKVVYAFTQQPVFPPPVWQIIEPQTEDVDVIATGQEELKYYCTKYTYVSNKYPNKWTLP